MNHIIMPLRTILLIAALSGTFPPLFSQPADSTWFPFAPARHLAAIGLVDDWHKPLVTETGSLAYDFGPGPYAFPLTEVLVGTLEGNRPAIRQWLPDASVPIVATRLSTETAVCIVHAFTLIPRETTAAHTPRSDARVMRTGGLNGAYGWATPPAGTDPSFANVAWGTNRPLRYSVRVEPGSRRLIALGFCESYKSTAGARIMTAEVEGDTLRDVDPMAGGKRNQPVVLLTAGHDVNYDGVLTITVHPSPRSPDPNIILNTFWVFPADAQVTPGDLVNGRASAHAQMHWSCGTELTELVTGMRTDALLATFEGRNVTPVIRIRTRRPLVFDAATHRVRWQGRPFLASRPEADSASWHGDTLLLFLPRGSRRAEIVVMHGSVGTDTRVHVPDLRDEEERCNAYWQHEAPVPRMRIRVPDARMQYLLDASVRNIYQVREKVDGFLQYQPGPTVYRGLWLADVLVSGNTSLTFGDTASVRSALEAGFRSQLPTGQFRSLYPSEALNETPVFLTMMCRYARTADNPGWLTHNWPILQQGVRWIASARMRTLDEPGAAYAGLLPPGFVDGGISHRAADYGSLWWAMVALEHAIQAARDIGRESEADQWSGLLEGFTTSFRTAAGRDMREDSLGHRYLPITVAETDRTIPPQRGQYAFLLPLPYGNFFFAPDTLMQTILRGNLAMLDAHSAEGLILGSGWLHDGVWPWLGNVHSTAHLLAGNSTQAWNILSAVADHACPLATWMEEQQLRTGGHGRRGMGQMPRHPPCSCRRSARCSCWNAPRESFFAQASPIPGCGRDPWFRWMVC